MRYRKVGKTIDSDLKFGIISLKCVKKERQKGFIKTNKPNFWDRKHGSLRYGVVVETLSPYLAVSQEANR